MKLLAGNDGDDSIFGSDGIGFSLGNDGGDFLHSEADSVLILDDQGADTIRGYAVTTQ